MFSGDFLYSLDPKDGLLTRHFLSAQNMLAQNIHLNTSTPNQPGTLLLSSRTLHFPNPYIYATRGDMLFVIALPNDPANGLHIVARIRTTLSSITSAMLVSEEGRYLVLAGKGGLRVYRRTLGGASVVEVARLDMRDTPTSLLWL
jgi:hypothetical protein